MTQEIIEGVREIEREKGIEGDMLIHALEDALLAAYKKTPGASRHATVELDDERGDFRVYSIELPEDIEERLIEEARERAITGARAARGRDGRALARPRPTTTSTSTGPTSTPRASKRRTSRLRTSAASPRRRPSRSSSSESARPSAR